MSVNLSKGGSVNLTKADGSQLTRVRMGLGWDPIETRGLFGGKKTKAVDLDASCLIFDGNRNLLDQVWFQQLKSKDGAVQHTGDNRTGAGDGDDESIIVDLPRVNPAAQQLVFTVNSFLGQTFRDVTNATCRLVDETNGQEIARYDLSAQGGHTAQVMAKLVRTGGGWQMTAIGTLGSGRTFKDLMPIITPTL